MLAPNNSENVDYMCDFNAVIGNNVVFHKVKSIRNFATRKDMCILSHILFNNFTSLKAKQHTIWKWNFPKVFSLLICFSFFSLCYSGMLPYSEVCNFSPWRQQMVWLGCLLVQGLSWETAPGPGWGGALPSKSTDFFPDYTTITFM